jgi:UDP-glucose 4-epimerase
VEYILGDFSDKALLAESLSSIDTVFHLVTSTFPSTADLDPVSDVAGNLITTLNLIELLRALGIRRLLYLSSGGTVYGVPNTIPVPETHPLRPIGSYGIVKSAIEFYLMSYAQRGIIDPVIIRASNPYGPRQGHMGVQGLISTFLHQIADGRNIEVWGDGSVVRDYLHVTELASLCVRAAQSDLIGPMNAGSGVGLSIVEIIGVIERIVSRKIHPSYHSARQVDVPISILDVSQAKKRFDWTPRITIDEGLADTWQWIQNKPALVE